eukprot:5346532-Amphidinium_carterae.1
MRTCLAANGGCLWCGRGRVRLEQNLSCNRWSTDSSIVTRANLPKGSKEEVLLRKTPFITELHISESLCQRRTAVKVKSPAGCLTRVSLGGCKMDRVYWVDTRVAQAYL